LLAAQGCLPPGVFDIGCVVSWCSCHKQSIGGQVSLYNEYITY
jgi:hypothetical protein